jgi:hypothetical protein
MNRTRKVSLAIALSVASTAAPLTCVNAIEEVTLGQWFNLHTSPSGTCPGLDWRVAVDADRQIAGYVAWDRMKHSAKLSGVLNADDTFSIAGDEVGGNRHAVITGKVNAEYVALTINGTGTGCDKQQLRAPRINTAVQGGGG